MRCRLMIMPFLMFSPCYAPRLDDTLILRRDATPHFLRPPLITISPFRRYAAYAMRHFRYADADAAYDAAATFRFCSHGVDACAHAPSMPYAADITDTSRHDVYRRQRRHAAERHASADIVR